MDECYSLDRQNKDSKFCKLDDSGDIVSSIYTTITTIESSEEELEQFLGRKEEYNNLRISIRRDNVRGTVPQGIRTDTFEGGSNSEETVLHWYHESKSYSRNMFSASRDHPELGQTKSVLPNIGVTICSRTYKYFRDHSNTDVG